MSMQGIDTILTALANASGALERTARPGIKEFKEAAASAKLAADLLKAGETFLSNGIYVICDEPAGPLVDPAAHKIEMPEVTHIELDEPAPAPELLPLPAELAEFDTWEEDDAASTYSERTEALADVVDPEKKLDSALDPWDALWDVDHKDAFTKLLVAEAREVKTIDIPTDEERDAWLAQFASAPEEVAPEVDEEAQALANDALFEQKLAELEEAGVKESKLKRKHWKAAQQLWMDARQADPAKALDKLLLALTRPHVTWDIPTDDQASQQLNPTGTEGGAE
jgi:hypothetical protein